MKKITVLELSTKLVQEKHVDEIDALLHELRWDWDKKLSLDDVKHTLSSGTRVFVATIEGRIVGMASLLTDYQLTGINCIVHNVVVLPEYRRMGISKMLMNKIITSVPEGATKLELSSGNTRQEAHSLYLSLGFKPLDTTYFRLKL